MRKENGITYLRFSNALRNEIGREFSYLGYISGDENIIIAQLHNIFSKHIRPWGVEILTKLSIGINCEGIVIFENLPYENIEWSPQPGAPAHSAKETSLSEHLMLAISSFFGQAYGVSSEGYRLVNDLIPSHSAINSFTGNGALQLLGLHYENASLRFLMPGYDYSPKGILLTGVSMQNVGGPVTPVAIASHAIELLPCWAIRILRTPCTTIAAPERHRSEGNDMPEVGPSPVIVGAVGKEEVVAAFYGDMMRPISVEAEKALALLNEKLNEVAIDLKIAPGIMAYIANGRVLHGRSNFEPIFDENNRAQRWIQRVFVTGRLDAFLNSKPITDRVFDITQVFK